MNNTEMLLKLKKEIEDAKIKKAQLQGKLQTFEEQLKKEFDCESLDKADEMLYDLNESIRKNEEEFENRLVEIKGVL
jgi:hypothetical protein